MYVWLGLPWSLGLGERETEEAPTDQVLAIVLAGLRRNKLIVDA